MSRRRTGGMGVQLGLWIAPKRNSAVSSASGLAPGL